MLNKGTTGTIFITYIAVLEWRIDPDLPHLTPALYHEKAVSMIKIYTT